MKTMLLSLVLPLSAFAGPSATGTTTQGPPRSIPHITVPIPSVVRGTLVNPSPAPVTRPSITNYVQPTGHPQGAGISANIPIGRVSVNGSVDALMTPRPSSPSGSLGITAPVGRGAVNATVQGPLTPRVTPQAGSVSVQVPVGSATFNANVQGPLTPRPSIQAGSLGV